MSSPLDRKPPTDEHTGEDTLDREPTDVEHDSLVGLIEPMRGRCRPELVVLAGRNAGEKFPVKGPMTIGRSSRCDVRLLDEGISRQHALVTLKDGEARLEDLGSANGILVNGARVRFCRLRDGDQVRLGANTILRFTIVDEVRKRLEHADRLAAIGQLAAGVAHEINNPTQFLVTNAAVTSERAVELAEVLAALGELSARIPEDARERFEQHLARAKELTEDISEASKDNVEGVERIRGIAKDLRWFARSERDGVDRVRLGDVIRSAQKIVETQTKRLAHIELDVDEEAIVWVESAKLTQVVMNLLLNAAQAMPTGEGRRGHIVVSARVVDGELVLAVDDDGPGVPLPIRAKIFEPFFTTKEREMGTGLGLSLCADIVRKHGGVLTVSDSELGGARFELRAPARPRVHSDSGMRPTPKNRPKARVLLVDDDRPLLRAMRRFLSQHHHVTVAQGGKEALDLIASDEEFDVIFCDLVMPGVDGVAVYRELEQRAPHLLGRLVFWTGGTFGPRMREFISGCSSLCLGKPVSEQAMLEVVDQVRTSGRPATGARAG